jgi:AAA+ ATPase superfamily predicted ATPase
MKNKIKNPFITGGYVSPEYFCDRQDETTRLQLAISSRRNTTLISLRRMGKTGLLKHVMHQILKEKNPPAVVYVDLMATMNVSQMLNTLSSAVVQLRKDEKNFFEKLLSVLSALRPRLTIDSLTGQPSLDLKVESPEEIQSGFEHLLSFISGIKQDVVFMFDEFQQISQYPEKNTEHMLRTIIQSYPAIPFIFSGSSKHMLEPMFLSAGRPFYQSSGIMYLDKIQKQEYIRFILESFSSGGKTITDRALSMVLDWTRLHTFYVQYICNLLFETSQDVIDTDLTNNVLHHVLLDFEPLFASYRNLIPAHQYKLLQAIAVENGISQPTSGIFIKEHNLTTASSVAASLKALHEKEMIVREGDLWIVYDVFFARWLEYHYKK